MENLHIKFQVTVAKSRYSRYQDDGDAELEFDIPEGMFKQDIDYAPLLRSLLTVAYQNYLEKKSEDSEEEE